MLLGYAAIIISVFFFCYQSWQKAIAYTQMLIYRKWLF